MRRGDIVLGLQEVVIIILVIVFVIIITFVILGVVKPGSESASVFGQRTAGALK